MSKINYEKIREMQKKEYERQMQVSKPKPGNGKKAFKTVTEAVKAAEAARDEAREMLKAQGESLRVHGEIIQAWAVEAHRDMAEAQNIYGRAVFWCSSLLAAVIIIIFIFTTFLALTSENGMRGLFD